MWTHARHIDDVHLWLIFHFFESTCSLVIIHPEQPSTLPNIYYDNGFHANNIPMTRFWYAKTTRRPPKNSIILNNNLGVRRKMPFNFSSLLFYRFDLLNSIGNRIYTHIDGTIVQRIFFVFFSFEKGTFCIFQKILFFQLWIEKLGGIFLRSHKMAEWTNFLLSWK